MNNNSLNTSLVPLLGRLLLALLFLLAGFGKLMNPAGTIGYFAHVNVPMPSLAYGIALILEIGGGLAILTGFFTRYVAVVLALFCLYTAFAIHGFGDRENMSNALKNIAIAGGFVYVVAFGAGAWSLDAMMARRRGVAMA